MSPTTPTDFGSFPPPLTRSSTLPTALSTGTTNSSTNNSTTNFHQQRQDRSRLAPEDAFLATSPPRRPVPSFPDVSTLGADHRAARARLRHNAASAVAGSHRSRSRRSRKRTWKKLMWVKQSYPDNYTDQNTFLESLQRNPRLQPYDFWPLVADSTVIVQHVCSVILFIVCFVLISQERVSPVSIVSFSSMATFLGWLLWERWEADEERKELGLAGGGSSSATAAGRRLEPSRRTGSMRQRSPPLHDDGSAAAASSTATTATSSATNLSSTAGAERPRLARHSHSASASSLISSTSATSQSVYRRYSQEVNSSMPLPRRSSFPLPGDDNSRLNQRLSTVKSAILIYSTLLGLSPILKSLTKSTSSDSIWAMSFWLLTINIFFFDYSGGVRVNIPASLSTNAALMASTVLASRLPSTGQVFSLTLFSIEVFGLFPVFRRYARHRSWGYHYAMTVFLVLGAGAGVGVIVGDNGSGVAAGSCAGMGISCWPWKGAVAGMVVSVLISAIAMGGCSWWLIGLQKYKNEIYGPWDPARPIIMSRRLWDDG
ncbi:phosphatidylinositol N-acetylglucosaminyltransferase [Colletotrichum paranaense]|uniref:Phosphatidylinositol N-acetylglucosaminyltransferase n=5 Tax=Colletotrichum acutatum species complex TaxID=2707335 RepID=A0A9P9X7I5_9PEZI|nr:phosphatidylinositol N-acetylglucosaminyltransferase [Colletotrichum paranaense]XP_060392446.1 phosphatidylinositol N-acetylglucosaminyltransferase [Colletotrichum abscissum]KAK0378334.1 phosphatidylinositol N-acetylglucosaminyltransferase [Colletotrichum limetticola]KAK1446319.1 phosphatidylinositol N-acetylglucosaminyltransferase [Colletotrichum melonis]KAK1448162.1 phosphatidylinositol N-acetylglucosaminyltransferase [Colletotrichum cuscutae]KAI3540748.1 phosphatidylinositol N-acetylgluc